MPAKIERVNLGICGVDDCEDCWVDMRVCADCGRGPLDNDEDDCGGCDYEPPVIWSDADLGR